MTDEPASLRIDKWLWHARFYKTRTLAAKVVSSGNVRLNAARISKPSTQVRPGDVLTFSWNDTVLVVEVKALGTRRGPAVEAQALYEKRETVDKRRRTPGGPAFEGGGRPTKKDRRALDQNRDGPS
ncbi:RNA-binding S4 domain-containing protein [Algicella marina]|uniref:RNA-binding S4 domain-containing protein n=1 Tax=Algicella marina TaxID=2683284 RepID=A0A6P1T4V9_9RHOB|nr:RNA-binding S4 domain-containing protein [Algicella marina]QHQ35582.1 RNA-binding S4 domain-containing protein [Algicella marina]